MQMEPDSNLDSEVQYVCRYETLPRSQLLKAGRERKACFSFDL